MSVLGIPGTTPRCELTRVYVWQLPVRLTHWAIAISIIFLAITGLYIAHPLNFLPFSDTGLFLMGWVRTIHYVFATIFGIAVLARVVWMFQGNKYARWDKFIPVATRRRKGLIPTVRFYLFTLQKPPGFIGHNPLAGLTYTGVFLIYFLMLGTGFALYSHSAHVESPFRMLGFLGPLFGGLQTSRWLHHIGMWLLLGFAAHHVYSAILTSTLEANGTMESMFSGLKFVPPEDLVYSGYRFKQRREIHEREKREAEQYRREEDALRRARGEEKTADDSGGG